ncbi:MAG: glycosyltransferase family 2 protein [Candidatus Binatia bacterium]
MTNERDINVTVIIPTFNRVASLRLLLESLGRSRVTPSVTLEVLVVDNGSTTGPRSSCSKSRREWNAILFRLP